MRRAHSAPEISNSAIQRRRRPAQELRECGIDSTTLRKKISWEYLYLLEGVTATEINGHNAGKTSQMHAGSSTPLHYRGLRRNKGWPASTDWPLETRILAITPR